MLPLLLSALTRSVLPDEVHVTVGGVERTALVFAPSKASAKEPPVVFMFHGHGGSAARCASRFSMEKRMPEALVV